MKPFYVKSASEQVAAYLREQLIAGRWSGTMPGAGRLQAELGIGSGTVEAALILLEKDGILQNQGGRRGRRIELSRSRVEASLRIVILTPDTNDRYRDFMIEIRHGLEEAGHTIAFADKFAAGFVNDIRPLARLVKHTDADAWLVIGGSRPVLEWFSVNRIPSFALFGRMSELEIPGTGPNHMQPMITATRRLIGYGHRRIVLLSRPARRLPEPGLIECAFLAELEESGFPAGPSYHLPSWEDGPEGLHECLKMLFRLTPPTALIVDEAPLFAAVQQFLAERRILVPQEVSLICTDGDPHYDWCHTTISHIRWDSAPLVRRVLRWADNLSQGKEDKSQSFIPAEFVEGGSIGRAPM